MRLNVVISAIAMLAIAASGQHTVNCWGKASHPSFNKLRYALGELEHWVSSVGTDGNTCIDVYCQAHMSIRYCDEGGESRIMPMQNIMDSVKVIAHDCKTEYNGETVAGGVVDHPDWWSVIVQTEDDRCKKTGPHYYGPADL